MIQLPDIRQIRIFIAIEETRSFTAAANKMSVTQSAVSHSIKSLESQLECKLIERLGKKCILTPHGEVFLHHAKKAVEHLAHASQKMKTLNNWGYSALKIGASHSLCQYVIPKTLDNFYKKNNKAEIFITAGDTSDLLIDLAQGKLDLAFGIHRSVHENDFLFIPLFSDELCFITAATHPWATDPQATRDYGKERFITYGNDTATSKILDTHLAGLGIKQRSSISMSNMESIKEMTTLGLGVGIISDWVAHDALKNNSLVKHSISPPPTRQWGYYVSKTKTLSLPEEQFASLFNEELERVIEKHHS